MSALRIGQRVRVRGAAGTTQDIVPIGPVPGVVRRIGWKDNRAWVELEKRVERDEGIHPFPTNDPEGRGTYVLTWPLYCEVLG